MHEKRSIEFSFHVILKTVGLIALIAFLVWNKELITVLIISFIIASAYAPTVEKLKEHRVPKALSAIILYALTITILSTLLYLVIQPLSQEVNQLAKNIPTIMNQLVSSPVLKEYSTQIKDLLTEFSDKLHGISFNAISLLIAILGGFLQSAVVLVLSFYLTIENREIKNFLSLVVPKQYQDSVISIWGRAQRKMGHWLKAQLFLMFVIGILTYIGLSALGIHFALSLAILAGLFELIPYAGPIFSAIVAVFTALVYDGPFYSLLTLLLFFLIQQAENYLIVPKIMQRVTQLNPILVISVLYVGGKLGGPIGGFLAIPITLMLLEAIREYQSLKTDYEEN